MKLRLVGCMFLSFATACGVDLSALKRSDKDSKDSNSAEAPDDVLSAENASGSEKFVGESEADADADADADDGPQSTAPAQDPSIDVTLLMHYGTAKDKNCVSLQFNDDAPQEFGCNSSGEGANGSHSPVTKKVLLRAKPFCNKVRIIDNNVTKSLTLSTENPAQIKWGRDQSIANFAGIRLFQSDSGTIDAQVNDSGDASTDIDVHFQITGLNPDNVAIENGQGGCKP